MMEPQLKSILIPQLPTRSELLSVFLTLVIILIKSFYPTPSLHPTHFSTCQLSIPCPPSIPSSFSTPFYFIPSHNPIPLFPVLSPSSFPPLLNSPISLSHSTPSLSNHLPYPHFLPIQSSSYNHPPNSVPEIILSTLISFPSHPDNQPPYPHRPYPSNYHLLIQFSFKSNPLHLSFHSAFPSPLSLSSNPPTQLTTTKKHQISP